MTLRRLFAALTILAVITPCVAVWIAPRHPQSIHARRNQRGWDG